LQAVRGGACGYFTTVLSPDYNAAHADHFHLDQAKRLGGWGACNQNAKPRLLRHPYRAGKGAR